MNKTVIKDDTFEMEIDKGIYHKDIVLKASYNFLDRGYFFFSLAENGNVILHFRKKAGVEDSAENIVGDYTDELLAVYLRDKLERDNKEIREKIIGAAIANSIDSDGYIEIDTNGSQGNEIDFDKDIDEILKEIENDPELKIDEAEIERILKEIEEETQSIPQGTESFTDVSITLDVNAVKDVKKKFQDK